MTADARFSQSSRKLTNPLLFTIRVVQHCAAISATAELLQNVIITATFIHGIFLVYSSPTSFYCSLKYYL